MVLASGKTSRLYKRLVLEERLAAEISCSHSPGRYPGWLGIQLEMLPGKDRAKAEKIILDEVRKLSGEAVPDNELTRAKRVILSQSIFHRESMHELADSIARTVLVQSVKDLKEQFNKWAQVTPADVQRVAKQYLNADKPVLVWSLPKEAKPTGTKLEGEALAELSAKTPRALHRSSTRQGGASNVSLQKAQKLVLPSGLTILMMENRRLPIVYASVQLKNVRRFETAEQAGLAQLMGSLLEEGTALRSGDQIAEAIEDVGGTLNMVANGGSVKVLKDHQPLAFELLFDSLLHPSFANEPFERKREEQLAEIAEAQEQPLSRASMVF